MLRFHIFWRPSRSLAAQQRSTAPGISSQHDRPALLYFWLADVKALANFIGREQRHFKASTMTRLEPQHKTRVPVLFVVPFISQLIEIFQQLVMWGDLTPLSASAGI